MSISALGRCAAGVMAIAVAGAVSASAGTSQTATVRLVFGGDVMLGRGVASLVVRAPADVFGGVHSELAAADVAIANLESPLTLRRHLAARGAYALEAKPAAAALLRSAGFDALAIANNHAGDAGPGTVPDTMRALAAAGLATVGAGATAAGAYAPRLVSAHGVRIAFLSFDTTGEGPRAGRASPGVAWWDAARVRAAVTSARAGADLVIVGLHGGSDYNPTTDPRLLRLGHLLAAWGADVVWGSGPHVVQPTRVVSAGGRPAIVATSLGNLLFDQHIPGTREGVLLEVLAGAGGVRAYRLGATSQQPSGAVVFGSWRLPRGNAAALGADWWTLAGRVTPAPAARPASLTGFPGQVVAAALGDPEGDGTRQLVVSFWRPYRPTDVNALLPRALLVDRRGLTSHVGLYRPGDRRELWVAGTVLRPVVHLAACDGGLAVAYSTLNGKQVDGVGAWRWRGFGFSPLATLAGRGRPACADIDGDGRLDPLILERSSR